MNAKAFFSIALVVVVTFGGVSALRAQSSPPLPGTPPVAGAEEVGLTPPRLSYTDGEVSFWRPGAPDWTAAQINTPLAPNDELYTGHAGTLEIQIGARAFVRGWADTQLGLVNQEPDFLQIKVTAGHASLDVRTLEPGRTIELDTPHAAFTIEQAGYYRVDVTPERTQLVTRRGGRTTVIPPGGTPMSVAPSEEVVVEGASAQAEAYVAPQLDQWDRWNYARTDDLLDSVSTRYVSTGVYGVDDLDHYGTWRVVAPYGSIWVPDNMPSGWAPYSTGSWVWDPRYGWTWVDISPWGWTPYHYGRWVFVNGFWGWAPGPPVVRPVYAPALVAFFGGGPSVSVTSGPIAWCALGWGEPVIPWWGRPGFAGRAWWGGWGGPRVVNNVEIRNTTVVNVQNITVYRNASVHQAVIAVDRDHFGQRPVRESRVAAINTQDLRPIHGAPQVRPTPVSLVPEVKRAGQPPRDILAKPVVATRAPQPARIPVAVTGEPAAGGTVAPRSPVPAPRLVSPPRAANPAVVSPRPPLGSSAIERPRPSAPRAPDESERPSATAPGAPTHRPGEPATAPTPGGPATAIPPPPQGSEHGRSEPQRPAPRVTMPAPPTSPEPKPPAPPELRTPPTRPESRPAAPVPQAPPSVARPIPGGRPEPKASERPPTVPSPSAPTPATPPPPIGARPEPPRPEPRRATPAAPTPPQNIPAPEVKSEPGRSRPAPPQAQPPTPSPTRPQPPRPEPRVTAPVPAAPPQATRPVPQAAPPAVIRPAPREGRPEAPRPSAPASPAPGLPGEPANRLYPGRSEKRSPGATTNAQQHGAPNAPTSREHPERSRG